MLNRWNFLKTGFYEGIILVQHSAGIMTDARASADQLRTLNTLAHQAAGYEILLGRDVYEDPSAVASVLTNAEKV